MSYVGPAYKATGAVAHFKGQSRFGHTDDIEDLWDDTTDYILGTIFGTCFMFALTLVFFTMLSVFSCCCRSSFLSGRRPKPGRQALYVRIILGLCCGITFIMSIVYMTAGSNRVRSEMNDFRDLIEGLFDRLDLASKAVSDSSDIIERFLQDAQDVTNALPDDLGLVCPSWGTGEITDITDLKNELATVSYDSTPFDDFEKLIDDAISKEDRDDFLDTYDDIKGWVNLSIWWAVPTMVFSVVLLIPLIRASVFKKPFGKRANCVFNWMVWPLYIIVTIGNLVLASALNIILFINTDFCTGGKTENPEGTLRELIFEDGESSDEFIDYYVFERCQTANPIPEIDTIQDAQVDVQAVIDDAVDALDVINHPDCDTSEIFNQLNTLTDSLQTTSDELFSVFNTATALISCEEINGLYVDAVHDQLCTSVPNTLWLMMILVVIFWLFGMIALTFRAGTRGVREDKEVSQYENEEENPDRTFAERAEAY
jgi:hypothetical protein